jgi:hypothetical protein
LREVRREFTLEDLGHDTKEDEAAFSQSTVVHGESLECGLHHVLEVWSEDIGTNSLGNRTDSVGGDTSEVVLVLVGGKGDERDKSSYCLLEVWLELSLGGVGSGTDSASDGDLDGNGTSLEKDKESLHEEGEVVDNVVAEDLEVRVETCAGVLLCRVVDDEVEQNLIVSPALLYS